MADRMKAPISVPQKLAETNRCVWCYGEFIGWPGQRFCSNTCGVESRKSDGPMENELVVQDFVDRYEKGQTLWANAAWGVLKTSELDPLDALDFVAHQYGERNPKKVKPLMAAILRGEGDKSFPRHQEQHVCEICGVEFEGRSDRVVCSKSCAAKMMRTGREVSVAAGYAGGKRKTNPHPQRMKLARISRDVQREYTRAAKHVQKLLAKRALVAETERQEAENNKRLALLADLDVLESLYQEEMRNVARALRRHVMRQRMERVRVFGSSGLGGRKAGSMKLVDRVKSSA